MRRLAVWLLLVAGCAGPGSTTTQVEGVHLSAFRVGDAFDVEVVNDSSRPIYAGCGGYTCERPTLQRESAQGSGAWDVVEAGEPWRMDEDRARQRVDAETALVLGLHHPYGPSLRGPGTYRMLFRFETEAGEAREVGLEYTVVGWPASTGSEALELRARAERAGCEALSSQIGQSLIDNLEPDPLIDMYAEASEYDRLGIGAEMLDRGGFTDFLVQRLTVAPNEEAYFIAGRVARFGSHTRRDLRRAAALRLLRELDAPSQLDTRLSYDLSQLSDAWPDDGVLRLIERLRTGPEEGASLGALLDLFVYAFHEIVDPYGADVFAAVEERCVDARSSVPELRGACERATQRFGPGGELTFWARGMGLSGGCGGFWMGGEAPVCAQLSEEWTALRDRAGPLELVFH